jgi:hypothetical protein
MRCRVVEYFIIEKRNRASWLTSIREEPCSNLGREVDSVSSVVVSPQHTQETVEMVEYHSKVSVASSQHYSLTILNCDMTVYCIF